MANHSHPPILTALTNRIPEMVSTLERYVQCESPSGAADAVSSFVSVVAADFASTAPRVRLHKLSGHGPALQVDFPSTRRASRVLLLGHTDTVYPLGTLRTMPCRQSSSRLYGPGAFDMKGGIVQALFALRALLARGPLPCPVTLLLVPDEEVGSPASQPLTAHIAKASAAVLVLEPAAGPEGACKTSRKGVARYTLQLHGRAAHSGLDFEQGASAIVEAAHQAIAIHGLSRPKSGLTLNPGVISGGTRPNVVAAEAEIGIDVRFRTAAQAERADRTLRKLRAHDPRCRLELSGGIQRPPFEPAPATQRLYRIAAQTAKRLGFALPQAAVGGASDGNFTASLGIPTLDGLGAVGDHAHSPDEFVYIRQLPRHAALLAELIIALAAGR